MGTHARKFSDFARAGKTGLATPLRGPGFRLRPEPSGLGPSGYNPCRKRRASASLAHRIQHFIQLGERVVIREEKRRCLLEDYVGPCVSL